VPVVGADKESGVLAFFFSLFRGQRRRVFRRLVALLMEELGFFLVSPVSSGRRIFISFLPILEHELGLPLPTALPVVPVPPLPMSLQIPSEEVVMPVYKNISASDILNEVPGLFRIPLP